MSLVFQFQAHTLHRAFSVLWRVCGVLNLKDTLIFFVDQLCLPFCWFHTFRSTDCQSSTWPWAWLWRSGWGSVFIEIIINHHHHIHHDHHGTPWMGVSLVIIALQWWLSLPENYHHNLRMIIITWGGSSPHFDHQRPQVKMCILSARSKRTQRFTKSSGGTM